MPTPRAQRTLVKSPPELWAEVSDVSALARHLGRFGEIRITRLEPETTVAWEGDRARGTVQLEPSGWGTKVTLTAELAEQLAVAEPDAVTLAAPALEAAAEPEPVAAQPTAPLAAEPEPGAPVQQARPRLLARLFGRRRHAEPVVEVVPVADEPAPRGHRSAGLEGAERHDATAAADRAPDLAVGAGLDGDRAPDLAVGAGLDGDRAPDLAVGAALDGDRAEAILTAVLDDLGSAHHRPFSRS